MMQPENRAGIDPHTRKVIKALLAECRQPARLLELYYWSTEPELLPIIRGFAMMPTKTRAALEAFVRGADPNAVGVEVERNGQIRLMPQRDPRSKLSP